jgi:hypothetical protein
MAAGSLKMRYKVSSPVRTVVSLRRQKHGTISARASRTLEATSLQAFSIDGNSAQHCNRLRRIAASFKEHNRFSSYVAALNRNADYAVRAKGEATLLAEKW